MNHGDWQDQLAFYAAGTLPARDAAALERHLAACSACRAALDEWRGLAWLVEVEAEGWAQSAPPLAAGLRVQVATGVPFSGNGHSRPQPRVETDPKVRRPSRNFEQGWTVPITMAAALLVVILFGALLVYLAAQSGDEQPAQFGAPASVTPHISPTATENPPTQPPATPVALAAGGLLDDGWDLGILPTFTPSQAAATPRPPRAGATPSAETPPADRCSVSALSGSVVPVFVAPDAGSAIVTYLEPGVYYTAPVKTRGGWLELIAPTGEVLGWVPPSLVALGGACDLPAPSPTWVPTPTAVFGGAIGSGFNLITLEAVGDIPEGALVRISHAWYEGSAWVYYVVMQDEQTAAEAHQDQLATVPGYDPAQPTPTAEFGRSIGMGGYNFIVLETIQDIPAGTRVGIGSAQYTGSAWLYDISAENGAHAQARQDQLEPAPGYDPSQPTPAQPSAAPTSGPTMPAATPTLPAGFTQWAEANIGVRFDYPAGWYVAAINLGLGSGVTLTTFDPAARPPMAAWGPGTLELQIIESPAAPAGLTAWVAAERAQFAADEALDLFKDEALTLPGGYPAWTLVVVSGSGHTITHIYTTMGGHHIWLSYTGDAQLANAVIATLRPTS